ncbi:MAG: diaminopimelate epimerase [Alistipes sp.]|nr:diaminopimelate epimerase [Alistipes sp.]
MNNNTLRFEIIKCHGSGNDFIMIDTTCNPDLQQVDWSAFARVACDRAKGIGSDGLLLVVRNAEGIYGMDMLNPDGTHAEMCGNGMRCVARLAYERGYLDSGKLFSSDRIFRIGREEPLAEGVDTFSVEISISTWSSSFGFFAPTESFVDKKIEALDANLRFTALNLGNPHIVAQVDSIDMELLESLGERVKSLKEHFPYGVNVSLYEVRSEHEIFVATYERGVGITLSCGTAMTASATAAALMGRTAPEERVNVLNRGGKVFCTTRISGSEIITTLAGNATFEWWGSASFDGEQMEHSVERTTGEDRLWSAFVDSINR